ncbi:hypothetical protein HYH03_008106 [Edaphochlamys debaryana]|uniref:HECT-type E3 ubiquitin transferase n=1 Tax=Edaphochlamys debaryana TaxID=47281 RepID=A0A836BZ46_9CHLO|nr:hypothetical protein HYH03_008106 [Edaphochlamys debaryana]|eukprot:KAG2493587.1 hypothetical protein HYH03_008106 [Edaphochlamys debaryana]
MASPFHVSVQWLGTTIGLEAWPTLTVRGLAQRFVSRCGMALDPDTLEVHLDKYLLPQPSTLGACLSRWGARSTLPGEVVRLKCVAGSPQRGSAKPRGGARADARGSPLHTVRHVAVRAGAALALPPGPSRLAAEAEAAAELCLLPFTFTSWTDAWEHGLMQAAVRLGRSLLPHKPSAAQAVWAALSELLDLPTAFAPRGPLYAALCALQLHTCLLAAAAEPQQTATDALSASVGGGAAPGTNATGTATGSPSGGMTVVVRRGRRGATAEGGGGAGGVVVGAGRARSSRQREAAVAAQAALLAKASAAAGAALQQLSCYGSELSGLLADYTPPPPAPAGGAAAEDGAKPPVSGQAQAQGQQRAVAGAGTASAGRDLRLQAAEVLEPYAALQLLEALCRLVGLGGPHSGPAPALLPAGTLPCAMDAHRSLWHCLLELATAAGAGLVAEADSGGFESSGAAAPPPPGGGPPTLELALVARTLDALLQLHVQAHGACAAAKAAKAAGGAGGGGGGAEEEGEASEDSEDSSGSGSGSSGSGGRKERSCPLATRFEQLPPCLDWLRDVTAVLEAACDVYSLAGGSDAETDGEETGPGEAAAATPPAAGAVVVAAVVAPLVTAAAAAAASVAATSAAAAAAAAPGSPARPADPALASGGAVAGSSGVSTPASGSGSPSSSAYSSADASPAAASSAGSASTSASAASTPTRAHSLQRGGGSGAEQAVSPPSASASEGGLTATAAAAAAAVAAAATISTPTVALGSLAAAALVAMAAAASERQAADDGAAAPSTTVDGGLLHYPATSAAAPPQSSASSESAAEPSASPSIVPAAMADILAVADAAAAAAAEVAAALKSAAHPSPEPSALPSTGAPSSSLSPHPAPSPALPPLLTSARRIVLESLLRAFRCPCLVEQLLAGGARSGPLCERSVWRHPRLASCAPAAAYQKQVLENLLTPLSYVYEDDDYDAPVLQVSRSDLLATSMAELMQYDAYSLGSEGICVSFDDEQAFGDGVLREWLTEVAGALFDPNAGLFRLAEGDVRCLHLAPEGGAAQDSHLELLTFAGRIIGLALRARVPLGFHLSSALFKLLQHPGRAGLARLGAPDLAQLEPRVAATCAHIAAAPGPELEALGLTWAASVGHLGASREVPLVPGGEEVPVTEANRREYLARLARFYCAWGCSSEHAALHAAAGAEGGGEEEEGAAARCWDECEMDAVEALAQGLADALVFADDQGAEAVAERLRPVSAAAFNAALGGETGAVDVAAWRAHTGAPGFQSERGQAALATFWQVVAALSAEEQRRLLQFWTGISHLPAGGFKHLGQQLQLVPAPEPAAAPSPRPHSDAQQAQGGGQGGPGSGQQQQQQQRPHSGSGSGSSEGGSSTDDGGVEGPGAAQWIPLLEPLTADGWGEAGYAPAEVATALGIITRAALAEPGHEPGPLGAGGSRNASEGGASDSAGSDASMPSLLSEDLPPLPSRDAGAQASSSSSSSDSSAPPSVSTSGMGAWAVASRGGPAVAEAGAAAGGSAAEGDRAGATDGGEAERERESGETSRPPPLPVGSGLLAAHTCFFQLRLPLITCPEAMRQAVVESLAHSGFWDE